MNNTFTAPVTSIQKIQSSEQQFTEHDWLCSRRKIVGLSKLTRLVDCFAKRLQGQERLTVQIANAFMNHLKPKAVGVIIHCRHLCMESRGIRTQGEETITSAMLGELLSNLALRTEFLALANGR